MTNEAKEVLRILTEFLEANPDQRLGQALVNLGILTTYMSEGDVMLVYSPFYLEDRQLLNSVLRVQGDRLAKAFKERTAGMEQLTAADMKTRIG